jgi:Site-specific recombinases, DNA invertase Pin homologs
MKLIAYYRVSTERQGASGLGLEAQRERVQKFVADRRHEIVDEIVEVQSGKDDSRPELARALGLARLQRAGIIVAKLDRLARSARFLDAIVSGAVDVLFCDLPDLPPGPTGRFMVQLMGSIAELEAGMISERTRAALAAAKQRGRKLGGFRGTAASPKAREVSAEVRRARADAYALALMPVIEELRRGGAYALSDLAQGLTQRGIETPAGAAIWSKSSVRAVLARLDATHQRDITNAQQRADRFADAIGTTGAGK